MTAAVVALTGAALPAAGAARTPSDDATTGTPTSTSTPTASPTPTVSPTPTGSPTPTASAPADDRLLPDLITLPARDAYIQVKNGRRLRFTSALGNIGDGPIEVRPNNNRPCPAGQHNSTQVIYRDTNGNGRYNRKKETTVTRHRAGCMVYHRFHEHWHFKASARYVLYDPRTPDDVVVAARRKVSFCLRDTDRMPRRFGTWTYPESYGACSRRSPQGISIGWVDVYQRWLAGQVLRLPRGLDNGVYCLRTVVDPIDQLMETDNTNNEAVRALRIRGTKVKPLPKSYCR